MREDSNSSDLKRGRRKVFEDGGGGLTIVPVAEISQFEEVGELYLRRTDLFWQPGGAE